MSDRAIILKLETTLARDKIIGDMARERLGVFVEVQSAKHKLEQTAFLNLLERDRLVFKHEIEKESNQLALEMAREKADIEARAATRKNIDEGFKMINLAGGLIKNLL